MSFLPKPRNYDRNAPNVLITGTPGTGKTTTAELITLAANTRLNSLKDAPEIHHLEVGKLVKEKGLHSGWNEEWKSYDIDEDQVLDEMETEMSQGGRVVDYHGCDFFPERWFDLVIVLTTDNTKLYNRLESRGYHDKKIQENVECEIMQVILEEAKESYDEDLVISRSSDSVDDMEETVEAVADWIFTWVNAKMQLNHG